MTNSAQLLCPDVNIDIKATKYNKDRSLNSKQLPTIRFLSEFKKTFLIRKWIQFECNKRQNVPFFRVCWLRFPLLLPFESPLGMVVLKNLTLNLVPNVLF